jgi:A/G-specific adenine glycosylase
LLGGLWEFPGGKQQPDEDLAACLQREICEELGASVEVNGELGIYKHAYTHYRVTLHAFYCRLHQDARPRPIQVQALRWVKLAELDGYPMGKIDRQISRDLLQREATC